MDNHQRALSALQAIPAGLLRADWIKATAAAKAAGIGFDDWHTWSATGGNYGGERDCRSVWRSINPNGGISTGTLFRMALDHGWVDDGKNGNAPVTGAVTPVTRNRSVTVSEPTHHAWAEKAAYIWDQSKPLRGSLAEVYLKHRGCPLAPEDGDLRFLPAKGNYPPTMLARVTDAVTGEPTSLHFTRLAADGRGKAGTDEDKLLLGGHRKKGGVIRLWPDEAVTHGLALAEGIESALGAAHFCTPTWSCIDAGNLAHFPVLDGIESLTVVADHDRAGLSAARACATRWRDAGKEVRVLKSKVPGEDACDVAARHRSAA